MVNQIVYIVVCKIINTIYGICKEVQIMILKRKYEDGFGMDEYFCELTEELDNLAGLNKKQSYGYGRRHYILATNSYKKDHLYAIRIPGGTVGDIETDENDIILNLTIDLNYVVKTYPNNVNEIIKKYIGKKIEFES